MSDDSEEFRISAQCRRILAEPRYSQEVTTQLIRWLRHPNAAVSDIAGRCLLKLGEPVFEDLLAVVTVGDELPWPDAVWVFAGLPVDSSRKLPLLRSWLAKASGELEQQCAVSLAKVLVEQKQQGQVLQLDDIDACLRVMRRYAPENPAMRVHLKSFLSGLEPQ